jgi:hypothetical protein
MMDEHARRHMDAARFALQQHMTDRRCGCCIARKVKEPLFLFAINVGGTDVFWCAECDRPRCRHCAAAVGLPFHAVPHLCPNCKKAM